MIDLRKRGDCVWPERLKPRGYGGHHHEMETLEAWQARVADDLPHLDPLIAEQWIYRHWQYTSYRFLPLATLQWRLEEWSTADLLDRVSRPFGGTFHPDHDYMTFAAGRLGGVLPTAKSFFDTGTWYPPAILLQTSGEYIDDRGTPPLGNSCLLRDTSDTAFSMRCRFGARLSVRNQCSS